MIANVRLTARNLHEAWHFAMSPAILCRESKLQNEDPCYIVFPAQQNVKSLRYLSTPGAFTIRGLEVASGALFGPGTPGDKSGGTRQKGVLRQMGIPMPTCRRMAQSVRRLQR
jgi:hypothetical protein